MDKELLETVIELEDMVLHSSRKRDDDNAEIWEMKVDIKLSNKSQTKMPLKIYCSVYESKSSEESIEVIEGRTVVDASKNAFICLSGEMPQVKLWSAYHPKQYFVVVEIKDCFDHILIKREEMFGFISVERGSEGLIVNNRLLGVNPIDLREEHAHLVDSHDKQSIREQLKSLREYQYNTLITDHPVNDALFFELCDQFGFYVIYVLKKENNEEIMKKLRKHPSIILWLLDYDAISEESMKEDKEALLGLKRNALIVESYDTAVKKVNQPFDIEFNENEGTILIQCMDSGLEYTDFQVTLAKVLDGEVIAESEVEEVDLDPNGSAVIFNPFLAWRGDRDVTSSLIIKVALDEQTIGTKQIFLTKQGFLLQTLENDASCNIDDTDEALKVYSGEWSIEIDKQYATIKQIQYQALKFIHAPLHLGVILDMQNVDFDEEMSATDVTVKQVEYENIGDLSIITFHLKVNGFKDKPIIVLEISDLGEFTWTFRGVPKHSVDYLGIVLAMDLLKMQVDFCGRGPFLDESIHPENRLVMNHEVRFDEDWKNKQYGFDQVSRFSIEDINQMGIMFEQYQEGLYNVLIKNGKIHLFSGANAEKGEPIHFSIKGLILEG